MAQRLKCLPAMWDTRVRSLGREDPLEKEMVTHSSILAWRIPWTEEPGRLQSTGSQSDTTERCHFTSLLPFPRQLCISEMTGKRLPWLLVQWLRFHTPMQGPQVRSLAGELVFHMPHTTAKKNFSRND